MPQKKPPEKRPIEICGNCLHFFRHFVQSKNKDGFYPLQYGHCVYPRIKPRFTKNTCPHFTLPASKAEKQ